MAILLALASLLLNQPVRSDTAVTGEVTLRGHVLPVGGIRDKVLAARRAGVRHVLLPLANKRNVLEELPARTLKGIEVHYVKHVDEALDWAFGRSGMNEATAAALAPDLPSGVPAAVMAASWRRTAGVAAAAIGDRALPATAKYTPEAASAVPIAKALGNINASYSLGLLPYCDTTSALPLKSSL